MSDQAWILCAYEDRFEPCAADWPVYRIWSEPEPQVDFRSPPRFVVRSTVTAWVGRYHSPVLPEILVYVAEKDRERARDLIGSASCVVLFLMWLFAQYERQSP